MSVQLGGGGLWVGGGDGGAGGSGKYVSTAAQHVGEDTVVAIGDPVFTFNFEDMTADEKLVLNCTLSAYMGGGMMCLEVWLNGEKLPGAACGVAYPAPNVIVHNSIVWEVEGLTGGNTLEVRNGAGSEGALNILTDTFPNTCGAACYVQRVKA